MNSSCRMLGYLRKKIAELAVERQRVSEKQTARAFVYLASPSLTPSKEWFEQYFHPFETAATQLRMWLLSQGEMEQFKTIVREAVTTVYDPNLAVELARENIDIVNALDQVLVVADLTETGTAERLVRECRVIADTLAQSTIADTHLNWTAVFLISRTASEASPAGPGDGRESGRSARSAAMTSLQHIVDELGADSFTRVFLLNHLNKERTLIARDEDWHCLIGQLLYFLLSFPLSAESMGGYANWAHANSPSENLVTGFSAVSFVLPVEQILETVTVAKGAEIMNIALLTQRHPDRHRFYLRSFLQKNLLSGIDEAKTAFATDKKIPLRDPIASFPDFAKMCPGDYTETMSSIDAALPTVTLENYEKMKKITEQRLQDSSFSLDEHLDGMVSGEQGGLLMAEQFLKELKTHLIRITPGDVKSPQFDDPGVEIKAIRRMDDRIPRKGALVGRTLVLILGSLLAVSTLPIPVSSKVPLFAVLPAAWLLVSTIVYVTLRQELKNHIVRLLSLLRGKFQVLMSARQEEVTKNLLNELLKLVNEHLEAVKTSRERLETLVKYFREEYHPEPPKEFAFWKYVVPVDSLRREYLKLCSADIEAEARSYILERPLYPWKRLTVFRKLPPDHWEWGLIEKAAQLLDCGAIINLTVQEYFERARPEYRGFKSVVMMLTAPFLLVQPMPSSGALPERRLMVECGSTAITPTMDAFIHDLSLHVSDVKAYGRAQPYRISFFGFLEGVSIDDVEFVR